MLLWCHELIPEAGTVRRGLHIQRAERQRPEPGQILPSLLAPCNARPRPRAPSWLSPHGQVKRCPGPAGPFFRRIGDESRHVSRRARDKTPTVKPIGWYPGPGGGGEGSLV